MKICVFGSANDEILEIYLKEGEKLGEEMAKRGHSLVFGAGKRGMMGIVAKGVKKYSDDIIGVIPKFFKEIGVEIVFPECSEVIYTETMAQRKTKMEDLVDAFIITPGGMGTFEEFFEVVTLKQLKRHTKPIVVMNTNNYYDYFIKHFDVAKKHGFITRDCRELFYVSNDIDDILTYLENYVPKELDIKDLKK